MNPEPWHLDRRVPIALILTLLMQTAGFGWWASGLDHRVSEHQRRIASLEQYDANSAVEGRRVAELLARLDERLTTQTELLREIRERLGREVRP
jgi:hypothetical protein